MRILHLLSQNQLTGAEVHAVTLAELQCRDQHEVWICSDKIHVPLPLQTSFRGYLPRAIDTKSFCKRLKNIFWLRNLIEQEKLQVIHCHSRAASRHAYWACLGSNCSQVTTLHGRQHFSWSKRLFDIYGQYLIAICENVAEAMKLDFKTNPFKIKHAGNPVEASLYPFHIRDFKNDIKLAIIGRSSGPKGLRISKIIEHCAELWLRQNPKLSLEVVVTEPKEISPSAQQKADLLFREFGSRFQLLGKISDLHQRYKGYQVVIGSGRIAIEAILSGAVTFALGEHSFGGRVTTKNWKDLLRSNFGDIGGYSLEESFDQEALLTSVQTFLNQPNAEEAVQLKELTLKHFDPISIHNKILEAYKAAIFRKRVPRGIPCLMYHKIPNEEIASPHRIFVTAKNFANHLSELKRLKMTSITFKELLQFWDLKKDYSEFPGKPVLLTFDDGYLDNLINAEPLLKSEGFKAVIYLLADHRITRNTWDLNDEKEPPAQLMSLNEKRKLDPNVWEIGSHGFQHLRLDEASGEIAERELRLSRETLSQDLGCEILSFAYPFGKTNSQLPELAQAAGYRFAVNTDCGGLHLADDPHSIFRVNIFPEDGPKQIQKKTRPWYRKYFYLKRGR